MKKKDIQHVQWSLKKKAREEATRRSKKRILEIVFEEGQFEEERGLDKPTQKCG